MKVKASLFTPSGALRPWANVIGFLVTFGLLVGFTVTYVASQGRKICGIVVLIDDRNQTLPPASDPDTARFRNEMHRYRQNLGC
jgi:hypothetical protein